MIFEVPYVVNSMLFSIFRQTVEISRPFFTWELLRNASTIAVSEHKTFVTFRDNARQFFASEEENYEKRHWIHGEKYLENHLFLFQ
jgi:hypothetical protein